MDHTPASDRAPAAVVQFAATRSMLVGLSRAWPLVIAVDSARRLLWTSDEVGLLLPAAQRWIGEPVSKLIDLLAASAGADARDRCDAFVAELHEKGSVASERFEFGAHPSWAPVEASGFCFEAEDGELLSVCLARRLPPEAGLRPGPAPLDPKSRLAFILDATPDAVLVIDHLGFVTSANAAAGRILGHALESLIDQPLMRVVGDNESSRRIARMMEERGIVESEEIEITRADAGRAWLSISARAHRFPRTDGSTVGETIVVIRDVTGRHRAKEALERKNAELESCVQNVSHDLRSPLTSLLGFTRLLRNDYEEVLDAQGNQFLDRVEEAGDNMEALLQSLLELSRIGARPRERRLTNPRGALLQIRSELKCRLDEKRIALSIPANPPSLLSHPTQLYQLLSNLIGNAVTHRDAVAEADAPGRIEVEIAEAEGGWMLSVADDGPGIDPSDQDRIFEMFQTGVRSRSGRKSGGLGLAIVKKIVESHDGTISVESAPGEGARFIVQLPDPNVAPPGRA